MSTSVGAPFQPAALLVWSPRKMFFDPEVLESVASIIGGAIVKGCLVLSVAFLLGKLIEVIGVRKIFRRKTK